MEIQTPKRDISGALSRLMLSPGMVSLIVAEFGETDTLRGDDIILAHPPIPFGWVGSPSCFSLAPNPSILNIEDSEAATCDGMGRRILEYGHRGGGRCNVLRSRLTGENETIYFALRMVRENADRPGLRKSTEICDGWEMATGWMFLVFLFIYVLGKYPFRPNESRVRKLLS